MFRPAAMKHDDFVGVMREVVPQLIEDAVAREEQVVSGDKRRPAESSAEEPEPKAAECSKQESRDLWNALRDTQ
jgi:hypothetical protein